MIGTIANVLAVVLGSGIGLLIHRNLPLKYVQVTFQIMGLFTLVLGMKMALTSANPLVMVFSLIVGGLAGTAFQLDQKTQNLSAKLSTLTRSKNENFSKGIITAFLLFCVGSMTILGALEEGLRNDSELLLIKSVMDGFSSIALAVTFGVGVMFSAIPLLIFQGGITLMAMWLGDWIPANYISEISATGGIILLALGLNLLEITKIKIIDLLPALIMVPVAMWVWGLIPQ
jgi:uncharacterized membrane protein YqgA involved in biofilm formation